VSEVNSIEQAEVQLVDESQFFLAVPGDAIDQLLVNYQNELDKVRRIAHVTTSPEYAHAVSYFLDSAGHRGTSLSVSEVFVLEGAIAAMNRRYWRDALALTDIYSTMPQARRNLLDAQLKGEKSIGSRYEPVPSLPDFEETAVRATLADMLAQRPQYFAERVDGIFRSLSSSHVTNVPEGFSKRMIVDYMLSYGSIRHERTGLIHDLRSVIAKFMGRGEPAYGSSDVLVRAMYGATGQWYELDGGALRIRVYQKGTAHFEVHPDIAWKLNQVLATLYPLAIPAQFRTKPPKRAKEFQMLGRPLPFATIELLASGMQARMRHMMDTRFEFYRTAKEHKATYSDACAVLEALGGVADGDGYVFDYPIAGVLTEVVNSGCLPDQKAHQYYPTPEKLARIAVELADIGPDDACLEPSAGQGGIADHMPKVRTTCVEISPLHCAVLRAKGFKTVECDFIVYADMDPFRADFDVVVMNPPFSEGRAKLHTEFASHKVKTGGRLVAILPASMLGKDFLGKTWAHTWSAVYEREFAGTSAAVVILKAVRTR